MKHDAFFFLSMGPLFRNTAVNALCSLVVMSFFQNAMQAYCFVSKTVQWSNWNKARLIWKKTIGGEYKVSTYKF